MKIDEAQIHDMEDEFLKLQKLEIAIDSPQSKTSRLIDKYAMSVATYMNAEKLEKLIKEAEGIIDDMRHKGQVRGRVMSLKTMAKYLDKSERSAKKHLTLDMIERQNSKRSQMRASLYVDELLRDANIMKADIELFRKRGQMAGLTKKEINRRLAMSALDSASPVNAFGKRLKTLEKAVLRREASASEIDEYLKKTKFTERWQWVTISAGPCPDCRIRAGVVMTFDAWQRKGLPGSGRTICRSSCMCKLLPLPISEELFPETKTFTWDKESGVLTTFQEMKVFGADKNKIKS